VCFATWQKGRRKMRIANAGQSQPLLWKSGRCEKVNLVGFPLGIYDDVSYEEWGVVLDPATCWYFTPTAWPKAPTLKVNSTGPIVYGK